GPAVEEQALGCCLILHHLPAAEEHDMQGVLLRESDSFALSSKSYVRLWSPASHASGNSTDPILTPPASAPLLKKPSVGAHFSRGRVHGQRSLDRPLRRQFPVVE